MCGGSLRYSLLSTISYYMHFVMQTYVFSNSFSIIETLSGNSNMIWYCLYSFIFSFLTCLPVIIIFVSLGKFLVDLDDNPSRKGRKASNVMGPLMGPLSSRRQLLDTESKGPSSQMRPNHATDGLRKARDVPYSPSKNPTEEWCKSVEDTGTGDARVRITSSIKNTGKNVKGRENERMEDASELLLDATTYPTLPVEVISLWSNVFFPLSMSPELTSLSQ